MAFVSFIDTSLFSTAKEDIYEFKPFLSKKYSMLAKQ